MYRNQYLVTNQQNNNGCTKFNKTLFNDLAIYSHPSLNVNTSSQSSTQIASIGFIIDPLHPDNSNKDIVDNLAERSTSIEKFYREIQPLSGRYVLIFKTDACFIAIGDACHLRQMYYGMNRNNIVLTSSPKLFLNFFKSDLSINKGKQHFIDKYIKKLGMQWFGDESIDDRLKKLLPNHQLNLLSGKPERIPLYTQNISNEDEILDYAASVLKGTYVALLKRYQLIQSLTAGVDSRILLAASKEYKDDIQYYVFNRGPGENQDVKVSQKLTRQLNLNFKTIKPAPLEDEWISLYKKEHIQTRILPVTVNIQHHYNVDYDDNILNVNGNVTEITRCHFGYTNRQITLDMILAFSNYHKRSPYITKQLGNWYEDATKYAHKNNISLLDLFYWEQRMGNWGAHYPYEQDIAIDEISPFNNRSLLLAILSIDVSKRKAPHYIFFKLLIKRLWSKSLSAEINPDKNYFNKFFKGKTMFRYRALKVQNYFLKLLN